MNFNKYLNFAQKNLHTVTAKQKHFCFILYKKKLIGYGVNQKKTHPLAAQNGYRYPYIHAELAAILSLTCSFTYFCHFTVVSLRLSPQGDLRMAKPCKFCRALLERLGPPKKIWYSTATQSFEELVENK